MKSPIQKIKTPLDWFFNELCNKDFLSKLPMDEFIKAKQMEKIFFNYREADNNVKNWNKGGFINDNKYKQPIKHKK